MLDLQAEETGEENEQGKNKRDKRLKYVKKTIKRNIDFQ